MAAPPANRGRYAPSPTGPLHLGNLRTALVSWLHARLRGSTFVLRIEDNDTGRSRPELVDGLVRDLRWLGLDWDEGPGVGGPYGPYLQSERFDRYAEVLENLRKRDLAYPCSCSRRRVRMVVGQVAGGDLRYPGTCARRDPQDVLLECEALGREPAWRFRVPTTPVAVTDELLGPLTHRLPDTIGDVVLRRADGIWSYQMCVVVDDIDQKITEVVRGQDLWHSTPRQAALYAALGAPLPRYWHAPLVTDNSGEKLSKRDGAHSLGTLPVSSGGPQAVVGLLASSLGLARRGTRLSAAELLGSVDLALLERALRRPSGPTYRPMRPRIG